MARALNRGTRRRRGGDGTGSAGDSTAAERAARRMAERERGERKALEREVAKTLYSREEPAPSPVAPPPPAGGTTAVKVGVVDGQDEELLAEGSRPRRGVPVVEFNDVSKVYDGGVVGLDHARMRIGRGEFVFLVGPTGCGKSTCVRLLLKEIEPSGGRILLSGHDLATMSRRKVPRLRRNIGTIFQDFKLLPNRTVYANVAYSLEVIGESRSSIRRKVPDILRLVGLSTKLHAYPDELSGGEQQRVSIARAFVNHPPLLLADEPTGNLDPETSVGIMQLIYRINRTGTTVIVATHDQDMVNRMRRRVVELREGRVIRDQPDGLYRSLDESTGELGARLREELAAGDRKSISR
jgi:cell division transport system ATP-binding protein